MRENERPRLGSVKDAVKASGMAEKAVRAGLHNGTIPHVKVGAKYMVNIPLFLAELDRWSAEGKELDPAAPSTPDAVSA